MGKGISLSVVNGVVIGAGDSGAVSVASVSASGLRERLAGLADVVALVGGYRVGPHRRVRAA